VRLLAGAAIVLFSAVLLVNWTGADSLAGRDGREIRVAAPVTIDEVDIERGDSIAVIGDSIVFVSSPALRDTLGSDYRTAIDGVVGATVAAMADDAEVMAGRHPRQVVINLGTNDVILGGTLSESMDDYEALVEVFTAAGSECIHVVTLSTRMEKLDPRINERAEQFNEFLRALAHRPGITVLDWSLMLTLASEGDGTQPPVELTTDSVHPTLDGSRAFAWLVQEALESGC
jgi:lysophospholipase L1-like esterase